jgi:hypothetical protein
MCSLLDKLSAKKIFPRKFGIEDIFIKLENDVPKIKLLLDQGMLENQITVTLS